MGSSQTGSSAIITLSPHHTSSSLAGDWSLTSACLHSHPVSGDTPSPVLLAGRNVVQAVCNLNFLVIVVVQSPSSV